MNSPEQINALAKEIFEYCCINRYDNKEKKLEKVTSGWQDMHECAQDHYRNIAKWHFEKNPLKEMSTTSS